MASLGKNLFGTLNRLEDLLTETPDGPERTALNDQYNRLTDQAQDMIDANVQKATVEYNAAINALAEANKEIQNAINGLAQVLDVVNKIAEAISVINTLLEKIGVI